MGIIYNYLYLFRDLFRDAGVDFTLHDGLAGTLVRTCHVFTFRGGKRKSTYSAGGTIFPESYNQIAVSTNREYNQTTEKVTVFINLVLTQFNGTLRVGCVPQFISFPLFLTCDSTNL